MTSRLCLCFALASGGLLACPPQLTGEPCDPLSNDCPNGQACVPSFDGGSICVAQAASSGTTTGSAGTTSGSAGTTSGSTFGIFGTVTINSGAPIPVTNTAVVYAFKNASGIDGGISGRTPDLIANVDEGGAFAFADAGDTPYYLAAYYEFADGNGTRVAYSPNAVSQSSTAIALDIPTYGCTVVAATSATVTNPRLLGVTVDVRDVATGNELTSGVDAGVFSPGDATFGYNALNYIGAGGPETDPLFLNQWGLVYDGLLPSKPPADQSYSIAISAPGYGPGATCIANLGTPTLPSATGMMLTGSAWTRTVTDTVNWTVTGNPYDAELIEVHGVPDDAGVGPIYGLALADGGTSVSFPGTIIPMGQCAVFMAGAPMCEILGTFLDGVPTGLTGTYFIGSIHTLDFQTD